ncbi:MAG TPA: hypothetical protein VF925_13085 [Casimicrobiaceae bacterium]
MKSPSKFAIAVIGLTSVLSVTLGSQSAHALQPSSATTLGAPTIADCARLPLSQRDICKSAVSLKIADSAAPVGPPEAAAAHVRSADAPSADARSSGRWIASEAVDAQFASTFRSAVQACDGPFQIQLVDAPPQHQIRFRCLPR